MLIQQARHQGADAAVVLGAARVLAAHAVADRLPQQRVRLLAADDAQFQVPEMLHNIMPTMVMSAMVDRIARKALTYLVYSTATIGAARAREAGLVSEVVPRAELDAAVEALCATMLKAPAAARRGVKEYARSALHMDMQGAIDFARNLHATINSSAAMRPKPK